jgi:hypothetical protein
MADAGTTGVLRSPRQASVTFSLDGNGAPRLKNLFYVRFVRGNSSSSQSNWDQSLGFYVKSVERPAIQPITEELHQYNKKRQVHTGWKANPVRIALYDTADSLCLQMWSEYSRYYFGDFGHAINSTDWGYDVTNNTFNDNDNKGFGFNPSNTTTITSATGAADTNSQFFFDRIQVFQVYNGQYIEFDLINPKITSFDPDDFSYDDSSVALINLTLSYEAIIWANNGAPQAISSSSVLNSAFQDTRLAGDVYAVPTTSTSVSTTTSTFTPASATSISALLTSETNQSYVTEQSYDSSTASGALAAYGAYNFGSVSGTPTASTTSSVATDLSIQALANPSLASALSVTPSNTQPTTTLPAALTSVAGLDAATVDAATAAIEAVANGRSDADAEAIIDELVKGVLAAGALGTGVTDQVSSAPATYTMGNGGAAPLTGGLQMSPNAYGIINATRSPTSQLCYNTSASTSSPS